MLRKPCPASCGPRFHLPAFDRSLRPGSSGDRRFNAKRIAVRLQEELQEIRTKHNLSFDITAHNYPDHVKSSHELEDIVKSLLPSQDEWAAPVLIEKVPAERFSTR